MPTSAPASAPPAPPIASATPSRSRSWHLATAVIALVALAVQLYLSAANKGQVKVDFSAAKRVTNYFSYFTIQSNLLVLAMSVTLWRNPFRDGPVWRVLRFLSVLCITVTCLVDVTVLRPTMHLTGIHNVLDIALHIVVPALCVIGWAWFGPRPRFEWRTLAWAVLFPLAWLAYTLIRGPLLADWYPYPFVDVASHGYARVTVNCLVVAALIIGLGALLVWLDGRVRPAPAPDAPSETEAV